MNYQNRLPINQQIKQLQTEKEKLTLKKQKNLQIIGILSLVLFLLIMAQQVYLALFCIPWIVFLNYQRNQYVIKEKEILILAKRLKNKKKDYILQELQGLHEEVKMMDEEDDI